MQRATTSKLCPPSSANADDLILKGNFQRFKFSKFVFYQTISNYYYDNRIIFTKTTIKYISFLFDLFHITLTLQSPTTSLDIRPIRELFRSGNFKYSPIRIWRQIPVLFRPILFCLLHVLMFFPELKQKSQSRGPAVQVQGVQDGPSREASNPRISKLLSG